MITGCEAIFQAGKAEGIGNKEDDTAFLQMLPGKKRQVLNVMCINRGFFDKVLPSGPPKAPKR